MKVVDLNLLIYATNEDAPDHENARRWWASCLDGIETIGLPWVVLFGFLRITTNSRIMPKPLTHVQALELVDSWLIQEPVQIISPSSRHWPIFRQIIMQFGAASNLTTDAHIAALAIERGGILYSADNDFSRIPDLKWKNPLNL